MGELRMPPNKGDAADTQKCPQICFRKFAATFVRSCSPELGVRAAYKSVGMGRIVNFPKNRDEFLALLTERGAAHPEHWVYGQREFSAESALKYVFLEALWRMMENPNQSSYTPEAVVRAKEWAAGHPSRTLEADKPIVERMLTAGVAPEEISHVVAMAQWRLVSQILYFLDDNDLFVPQGAPFRFGIHLEVDGTPVGRAWSLDDVFNSARPGDYPDLRNPPGA